MQAAKENIPNVPLEVVSGGLLLSHIRDGDEKAAELLYHRFAGRLRNLAHAKLSKLLQSRLDADDIVQSVFRRFFQATNEGAYDCPTDEELWSVLMVITLNRLRTEEAFQRAGKRDVRRNMNMEALDKLTSFSQSSFASSVLREGVEEALEKLPEHFGRVTKLRLEGYEVAEIALRVGRSKRTVERILQESLIELRSMLQPEVDRVNGEDPT
jgi:RNA polymerase sigma-70 factor (ECF subfamily)